MSTAMNEARKIIDDFEDQFGDLTATEGDWLARQIANAIQVERNRIPRPATFITEVDNTR